MKEANDMRTRKEKKRSETPEAIFRRKLRAEYRKAPGVMVKVEHIPQGSMADYQIKYIHASQLDPRYLDMCLLELYGSGSCLLRFVDETRQPLDDYGTLWVHLGNYDDLDDRLEEAHAEVIITFLNAQADLRQRGSTFRNLTPAMQDALERSIERDDGKVMLETMKKIGEMQNQERKRIMEQRADTAKKLQTALDSMMAEIQETLQAQKSECETQAEPASQGRQFPPADYSPPTVGYHYGS